MTHSQTSTSVRIPPGEVVTQLFTSLKKYGFTDSSAEILARTFMENSLDGVYTHGLNRFPRFIRQVRDGQVKPTQQANLSHAAGAVEQWDGHLGPGILNALQATDRAMALARGFGMGCVALAGTNHWMRGGTYGWRAARQGCIFIGWTNTIANMPAWGAVDAKLGNNPLVLAIPYGDEAIVLDMAQSQFSYGAMEAAQLRQTQLPVPGGYDTAGNLSQDPSAILESQRALPAGYWKGAGLSLLLDMLATVLSGGQSTAQISRRTAEYGLSQVFIALDASRLGNAGALEQMVNAIIEDYRQSDPAPGAAPIRYPGESVLAHRAANSRDGIPVDERVWEEIRSL